jgi:hypothetical protein
LLALDFPTLGFLIAFVFLAPEAFGLVADFLVEAAFLVAFAGLVADFLAGEAAGATTTGAVTATTGATALVLVTFGLVVLVLGALGLETGFLDVDLAADFAIFIILLLYDSLYFLIFIIHNNR